jgi:hypothetical protein
VTKAAMGGVRLPIGGPEGRRTAAIGQVAGLDSHSFKSASLSFMKR